MSVRTENGIQGRSQASLKPVARAEKGVAMVDRRRMLAAALAAIAKTVKGTPIKAPAMPQSMPQKNTANSTMKGETETAVPATRGSI